MELVFGGSDTLLTSLNFAVVLFFWLTGSLVSKSVN